MKIRLFLILGALAISHPAYALDCAKASSPVDKMICTTPDLKKADADMSAAYFKLLRATTDPDFHVALIRSQRRWLKERSKGVLRISPQEDDELDDRGALLKMTRDRLDFLRRPEPIRTMEQQRKLVSEDSGGPFAGYESDCSFLPPRFSDWGYACFGTIHRQHRGRICSVRQEWATGHTTDQRLVRILKDGKPQPVANCSYGYAGFTCPDPSNDTETKATAHWDTNPNSVRDLPIPEAGKLWKYDPDNRIEPADHAWMRDCLFAPNFPPPELSRADPSRK